MASANDGSDTVNVEPFGKETELTNPSVYPEIEAPAVPSTILPIPTLTSSPYQVDLLTHSDMSNSAATTAESIYYLMSGHIAMAIEEYNNLVGQITGISEFPDISNLRMAGFPDDEITGNDARNALAEVMSRFLNSPTLQDVSLEAASVPSFRAYTTMPTVSIPEFTEDVPVLSIPAVPELRTYDEPSEPEVVFASAPERVEITLPNVPELTNVDIPTIPAINLPTLDAELIDEELVTPTFEFSFSEQEFNSLVVQATEAGILDMLQNRNYGLDPADETALFSRARDREQLLSHQAEQEVYRTYASSGLPFPPGAMMHALLKVRDDARGKVSEGQRELSIKRAELYYDGKKNAFQIATEWSKQERDFHNALMERAFNVSKARVQVLVDAFNVTVAAYKARQERYALHIQVYEQLVRAELAKVEIFKAQIEGARVQSEVNKNLVDIYKARIDAANALISMYRTDVEAFNVLIGAEKTKVDVFKAQVEAFAAKIEANKSEFQAYEAAVRGEVAKADAYKATADAYNSIVNGKKTQIEAYTASINATVAQNTALIEEYKVRANYYDQIRQAQSAYNQSVVGKYVADVSAYTATVNGLIEVYRMNTANEDMQYKEILANYELAMRKVEFELNKLKELATLKTTAITSLGEVQRALVSGATSSMNFNASLSDGMSKSLGISNSINEGASTSISSSTGTSYSLSLNNSNSTQQSVSISNNNSASNQQSTSAQVSGGVNVSKNTNTTLDPNNG